MYMPTNIADAQRLIRSTEKARTLFTEGYTAELLFDEDVPRVFFVKTPNGANYTVDLNKETCTCGDYGRHGKFCKHIIALEFEEIREEMEMDARAAEETEMRAYDPALAYC